MRVFVIHYAKLLDRKRHILEQFAKHNITDFEFVEIDRDELDREDTSMFEPGYNPAQIAISLSHFYAYKQIAEKVFLLTDAKKYMAEAGFKPPEGAYKKFKVMGKEFDPAKPDDYIKSFAINKMA